MLNLLQLKRSPLGKTTRYNLDRQLKTWSSFSLKKSQVKYFALVTFGRSGSTCLLDILSCHPQMQTNPHIFFDYNHLPEKFGQDKFIYSNKSIYGIKLRLQTSNLVIDRNEIEPAKEKLQLLTNKGVVLIYLERNNFYKRAISSLIAKSRKQFNFRKDKTNNKNINFLKITIPPQELIKHIEYCELQTQFHRKIIHGLSNIIYLTYEKDLQREEYHQQTLDKICHQFGVDSAPVVTRYSKVLSNKLSDNILNYDEIVEEVKKSSYAHYLE